MILNSFSTSDSPKRAVIAIHGWTGNVSSMEPVAKSLQLHDTVWMIPQAPYISEKNGFTWFQGNNETGWQFQDSFDILFKIIESLLQDGFGYDQIFLFGFSQGACLSMEFMIRQSFSLAGIIPVAGFIRYKSQFKKDATAQSKETPVLLIHGDQDEIILPVESEKAENLFQELGNKVDFHLVSAGHKIPIKAKNIIQDFIIGI